MELLLMALALSLLGVAVSAIAFAAATRDDRPPDLAPADRLRPVPSGFFADDRAPRTPEQPMEIVVQIQRHVWLEVAAAEAFHDAPTVQALHVPNRSPLVH